MLTCSGLDMASVTAQGLVRASKSLSSVRGLAPGRSDHLSGFCVHAGHCRAIRAANAELSRADPTSPQITSLLFKLSLARQPTSPAPHRAPKKGLVMAWFRA